MYYFTIVINMIMYRNMFQELLDMPLNIWNFFICKFQHKRRIESTIILVLQFNQEAKAVNVRTEDFIRAVYQNGIHLNDLCI